ncbi:MAG: carbohydrate ABC transporter permease [Firmicutes bacterium]|nr:carbohydrate ABC transporter permease [Bacillota bacterium]
MSIRKSRFFIMKNFWQIFIWVMLIISCALVLLPLAFMFTASAMPAIDILKLPYPWISDHFHWLNFWNAIRGPEGTFEFLRNTVNSLVVAVSVAALTVILSATTGYGLAKFEFKGRNLVFMLIMGTMMIPFETIMIPLYMVVTDLGLQDSYPGLIFPFAANAFGIFLMRQYLIPFPDEILDAARIDGAGELGIFTRVILPNAGPAIATLGIIAFRSQWDNLLWPLLIVQSENMRTIPLYITRFLAETHSDEGIMMAVAVLASFPMFILFFALSRYFVSTEGLTSSTKG